ncbi:hypothetical protein ACHQM5_008065 [Ranunculus cassubicifolius]
MQSELKVNDLVQEAQNRWLKPAEVLSILQNHENYQITEAPVQKPTSGSLFLYNKRITRFFRNDGHSWRKKNVGKSVREGHERLKVGNVEALNCYYAHGENNHSFQRRSFWMLDPAYEHIVLVHYRDVSEGNCIPDYKHLAPYYSSPHTTNSYAVENRVSISTASETYQSSSFSPSVESSSEFDIRSNGASYIADTISMGDLTAKGKQALGWPEEHLSLNGHKAQRIFEYHEEGKKLRESAVQNYQKRPDEDEFTAPKNTLDYVESHQRSGGNDGPAKHSDTSMLLQRSGGYATDAESVPFSSVFQKQDLSSCRIDTQDELFSYLDQSEKALTISSGKDTCAGVDEQQEKWASHWLEPSEPRSDTEDMHKFTQIIQNNFDPQFAEDNFLLLDSDNFVSSNATSLLEALDFPNCLLELEVSRGADSRLTLAQEQKFRILEISPDWGFSTENTKVIIAGSFLCDASECTWSCMFGENEVPVIIIQDGVLCCQAPPHTPGKVTLCVTSSNRESCSEVREFEYRSKLNICDNCIPLQEDSTKHREELLLLVRLGQVVLNEDGIQINDDDWGRIMETLLFGNESQNNNIKDWLLQQLLREKLLHWLSSKDKGSLTKNEQSVIHLVAGLGFDWALQPILKCGVNVNYRDVNGWTPLHWAANLGREKMVATLIAAGASAGAVTDPTSQDPIGKTAGSIAAASGHKGLAGYLSEVALTSHLSSLTLKETSPNGNDSLGLEVEKAMERISNENANSTDDDFSLKDSLAAIRNSAQAATRIQSIFNEESYKRRQQKEASASYCNEYGITPNELAAASKLAFQRFQNHLLDKSALSIQKKYRGWQKRQEFLALRQKIVMIQAHVRGYIARRMYKKIVWAVGVLDKVVLRWSRKRVGLRGFKAADFDLVDESDYEEIMEAFRNLKVYKAVDEALSMVLSMVESPEARMQYRRILESYWEAKADISGNEGGSVSQVHANT